MLIYSPKILYSFQSIQSKYPYNWNLNNYPIILTATSPLLIVRISFHWTLAVICYPGYQKKANSSSPSSPKARTNSNSNINTNTNTNNSNINTNTHFDTDTNAGSSNGNTTKASDNNNNDITKKNENSKRIITRIADGAKQKGLDLRRYVENRLARAQKTNKETATTTTDSTPTTTNEKTQETTETTSTLIPITEPQKESSPVIPTSAIPTATPTDIPDPMNIDDVVAGPTALPTSINITDEEEDQPLSQTKSPSKRNNNNNNDNTPLNPDDLYPCILLFDSLGSSNQAVFRHLRK